MIDYLDVFDEECARLSAAASSAGLEAAVPSCPDWRVADLLHHVAQVFTRVEVTLRTRSMERVAAEDLPAVPSFEEAVARLRAELTSIGPDEPVWNWTLNAPKVAAFWPRRMAQEVTVHRVDAELAAGGVDAVGAVDAEVAVDGIDELFDMFLTTRVAFFPDQTLGGSMHVHATDAEGEWLVSFEGGVADITRAHAKGDVAVRGSASDLLLLLWNRLPLESERFELFGDRAVLDRWQDLKI